MNGVLTFVVYMTILPGTTETSIECVPVVREASQLGVTRIYREQNGVVTPQLPESAFRDELAYCAVKLHMPEVLDACVTKPAANNPGVSITECP